VLGGGGEELRPEAAQPTSEELHPALVQPNRESPDGTPVLGDGGDESRPQLTESPDAIPARLKAESPDATPVLGDGGDESRPQLGDGREDGDRALQHEGDQSSNAASLLNIAFDSNGTRSEVGDYYTSPVIFNYGDGSSSEENYCNSNDRERLFDGDSPVTWNNCKDGCYGFGQLPDSLGGRFYYTRATPWTSQTSKCTCCYEDPRIHKSGVGNKIYRLY